MKTMPNLFQSGFVAAGFQPFAVIIATPAILVIMRTGPIAFLSTNFGSDAAAPSGETQSSIPTGAYLVLSLGVALTDNQLLDATPMRIRHISHRKDFPRPYLAMASLLILFCLGTAGFTGLALLAPPHFLVDLGHYLGVGSSISDHMARDNEYWCCMLRHERTCGFESTSMVMLFTVPQELIIMPCSKAVGGNPSHQRLPATLRHALTYSGQVY